MPNWEHLVMQMHQRYHSRLGHTLLLRAGLQRNDLQGVVGSPFFVWPDEFKDLYSYSDGIGFRLPYSGEEQWFFQPFEMLSSFKREVCDRFSTTHNEIAQRFFPFFDWHTGDAMGYFVSDDLNTGLLWHFDHECFEYNKRQPWSEFLSPVHDSLEAFFNI